VEYVRLWKAECTRHFGEGGGRSVEWMDARTRVQAAEEARARRGSAARERTADKGEKRVASGGEMAEAEERRVRFERDHIRMQGQVGPRGVGPRTPHHGGPIIANTTEALGRFLARKSDVDPTAQAAAVAAAKGSEERRRAERARSDAADASRQSEQELVGGVAAQANEGRRCATTTDAPRRGIKRAACAGNEHDGATTPTDAGTEAAGGAARAAAGAKPAAKTKKRRGTSKTGKGCKSHYAKQRQT
jgi:hypothetical protein